MSEYNIQMNKYTALNAEYDQLYPQPMKHANTHAKDGSDPITPADIGAYTKTEADTLLANKVAYVGPFVENGNFNDYTTTGSYVIGGSSIKNGPTAQGYYYLDTYVFSTEALQIAKSIWTGLIHFRRHTDGVGWTNWNSFATATNLDTKVSKSGDTMTGTLKLTDNIGTSRIKGVKFGMYLCSDDLGSEQWQLFINRVADGTIGDSLTEALMLCRANAQDGWITTYPVLHTGNAQTLGFTKIATGSYVGTGTAGSPNPNSLTFNLEPKVVIIVQNGYDNFPGTVFIRGQTQSATIGENYISNSQLTVGWSGNTVSWYTGNSSYGARAQLNISGNTYFYIALG